MDVVDVVDSLTDNIVALILIVAGIYFLYAGKTDVGWDMVKMAAIYVFGKSTPTLKRRARIN